MKLFHLIVLLCAGVCQARTWTDVQGRTIEAEIVSADDTNVTVDRGGKEVRLALARLSEADQAFVSEWLEGGGKAVAVKKQDSGAEPAPAPIGGTPQFDGKPLVPGGTMNVYEYPYSAETQEKVTKKFKAADTGYKLAIAVPADFDPSKPQRVFIPSCAVNNDDQARAGNFGAFNMYAPTCIANGWVCIAYDSSIGRSSHNTDLYMAYDKLKSVWPGITGWSFAVGGFSGGAKGCFDPCGFLLKADCKVSGAFLAGCNEDWSAKSKDRYKAPSSGYRKIKVFTSTGKSDNLVSAAHQKMVQDSLKGNGLRSQRNETFDGGHQFHAPHFDAALKWFAEPAAK